MRNLFASFAHSVSRLTGTPYAFLGAAALVIIWALSGPIVGYSERWQLIINTGTTIVTFLMVFIIQSAQNRDQAAVQLKLDELLRAVTAARTGFAEIEGLSEEEIEALRERFTRLAEQHRREIDDAVNGTDLEKD